MEFLGDAASRRYLEEMRDRALYVAQVTDLFVILWLPFLPFFDGAGFFFLPSISKELHDALLILSVFFLALVVFKYEEACVLAVWSCLFTYTRKKRVIRKGGKIPFKCFFPKDYKKSYRAVTEKRVK